MKSSERRVSIKYLREIVDSFDSTAKRTLYTASKDKLDGWYDYYAGFSSEFAEHVIRNINLPKPSLILDPWNGSGTTTHVAELMGYKAIGIDINPIASLVSSAKLARFEDVNHISGLINAIISQNSHSEDLSLDPLNQWLHPTYVMTFRQIEFGIMSNLAVKKNGKYVDPTTESLPPLAAFLFLALMRAARNLSSIKKLSNPTWIRPSGENTVNGSLIDFWKTTIETMSQNLIGLGGILSSSEIKIGDSRSLKIDNNSIDLVFTSPPYCTRIDYIVSTSFELAALRIDEKSQKYNNLRKDAMGTPLSRRGDIELNNLTLPKSVQKTLGAIYRHPSKASTSYYYRTYWQYFKDTQTSIGELYRVMKNNSYAILIVQSSYYKEIYIDLPEVYIDIGRKVGFDGKIIGSFSVKNHLAQINTRSQKYRTSTNYVESIVVLEKKI